MAKYPPDPPDWEVLISLEHRDGRAAICRDPDESLWLVWNLDDFSDTDAWDDQAPEEEWDPRDEFGEMLCDLEIAGSGVDVDGIVAIGGRLPPGAESIEASDEWGAPMPTAVAAGVWLAATHAPRGGEQTVRFFNSTGERIERPLPPHVEVADLGDVGEPCPACGASQWQLMAVPESAEQAFTDAGDEWPRGRRAAGCARCGYQRGLPSTSPTQHFLVTTADGDPEEAERRRQAHLRDAWRRAVEGLGTAPIGLERSWPGPREIPDWGGAGPDAISNITLDHGRRPEGERWISVTTAAQTLADDGPIAPEEWAQQNLVAALSEHWREDGVSTEDGATLREDLRRLRVEATVRGLPRRTFDIPVDGRDVRFLVIGDDCAWAGYGACGAVIVTVVARDFAIDDVELESADVAQYLAR